MQEVHVVLATRITLVIHSVMTRRELLVYEGECFTIEWGPAPNGKCQALEYYVSLNLDDQAKASALFARIADKGTILDKTKFTRETEKLYAFKPQPHRFFCFFVKGRKIIIVTAYRKQSDKAPKREIDRANSIRLAYLEQLSVKEEGHGKT